MPGRLLVGFSDSHAKADPPITPDRLVRAFEWDRELSRLGEAVDAQHDRRRNVGRHDVGHGLFRSELRFDFGTYSHEITKARFGGPLS